MFLRLRHFLILLTATSFFLFGTVLAQGPLDELTLGLIQKSRILSKNHGITDSQTNLAAQSIFRRLRETSFVARGPTLPYELTLISDPSANAYATAAGKVYVTRGIIPILEKSEGMWAAVLSHELAHAAQQHHYSAYLRAYEAQQRKLQYRETAKSGSSGAAWAAIALAIVDQLVTLALNRDEEHEADRIGLMMMAEAGYHPDFVLAFQQRMRIHLGAESKFTAFFSGHPRWTTREKHTIVNRKDALRTFNHYWRGRVSPGGPPPILTMMGKIKIHKSKTDKAAVINVPARIRNAKKKEVSLVVLFEKNRQPVRSALPEYRRRSNGGLGVWDIITPTSDDWSGTVTLEVPSTALTGKDRKLDAKVWIYMAGGEILNRSKKFKVKFPKP